MSLPSWASKLTVDDIFYPGKIYLKFFIVICIFVTGEIIHNFWTKVPCFSKEKSMVCPFINPNELSRRGPQMDSLLELPGKLREMRGESWSGRPRWSLGTPVTCGWNARTASVLCSGGSRMLLLPQVPCSPSLALSIPGRTRGGRRPSPHLHCCGHIRSSHF